LEDVIKTRVLVIDDSKDFCTLLTGTLDKNDCQVMCYNKTENVIKAITDFAPDVVLLAVEMSQRSGIQVLTEIKSAIPRMPVIMLNGGVNSKLIVDAMQKGAADYIPKTMDNEELVNAIRKISEVTLIKDTANKLKAGTANIIGESSSVKNLRSMINNVAVSDIPIFLKGESGTGKSMAAEAIHRCSKRKFKPFGTINCSSLPPTLLEAELFGYEKGSFTGAINAKKGKFEIADGGTIFLDEIGVLSMDLQVKILRIIQDKEFERIGGLNIIKIDVRIIAATNMNVELAIKEGRFREDLYYRLNVLPIFIPPLRERKTDIPPLAEHFLKLSSDKEHKNFNKLSSEVINLLTSYEWPGNIRELDNMIKRAVVLGKEPELKVTDFALPINSKNATTNNISEAPLTSLKDMEHEDLESALKGSSGNITKAAKKLGISRVTLYLRMKKHGISLKK